MTVRIAAVGDVHVGKDSAGSLAPHWQHLDERADLFLLAGDLTKRGKPEEALVLAEELKAVRVPVVAVLGNHDYELDREKEIADILGEVGVTVLDGTSTVVEAGGCRVGIAGSKGFGGGFPGAMGSDFGEPEMKAFMRHARTVADGIEHALEEVRDADPDVTIALMHYSPIEATLRGERLEIWPFLGCYYLAEAVDRVGADLALHGHAHGGSEKGVTPGGVHVRNVAQPVLRRAYALLSLGAELEEG